MRKIKIEGKKETARVERKQGLEKTKWHGG